MRATLTSILIVFFATTLVLGEPTPKQDFPQYRSEYLTKLVLSNKRPVERTKIILADRSKAERTASFLSLLALPALIGGLLTRDEKALSVALLSASIGLNVSAIYLRLHKKKDKQQVTILLETPLSTSGSFD